MPNLSKMSNKCRACLGFTPTMVSLFEPYRSATIAHFITSFTDIKIFKSQVNLPLDLCSVCLEELEVVLRFTNKCKDTDEYLRSLDESEIPVKICELKNVKEEPPHEVKSEEDDEVNDPECELDNDCLAEESGDNEDKLDIDSIKLADSVFEPVVREPTFTYFECHDCGERLKSKCKLRVHWKRLHSSFACEKCKRVFKAYQPFKKHSLKGCVNPTIVKVVSEGKKRHYYCRQCDYDTDTYNCIKFHSFRHTGEKLCSCDICGKTFTQWSGVSGHKESAHKLYKMEITCDYCGKHIKGRTKCYKHLKLHLNTTFQCDICKVILKRKQSLLEHIKRHYEEKKNIPATCEICGKVFSNSVGLRNHIKIIHHTTLYSCKICKYQNKNIYNVRKHEQWHFQENMLQCSLCYNFFNGQAKIKRHMRVVHASKTHFCVFCERGFMKRYVLLKHQARDHAEQLKSHTGLTYVRHNRKNVKKAQEKFLLDT